MAGKQFIVVKVRWRWWLSVYLNTIVFLCRLFGAEPNWERLNFWIRRGLKISVSVE